MTSLLEGTVAFQVNGKCSTQSGRNINFYYFVLDINNTSHTTCCRGRTHIHWRIREPWQSTCQILLYAMSRVMSRVVMKHCRPVSLLSIVSKVIEYIINICILNYLEKEKLPSIHQFGFHPGFSAADLSTNLYLSNLA